MARDYRNARKRELAHLANKQRIDDALYTRDLERLAPMRPKPSKAKLRARTDQMVAEYLKTGGKITRF